MVQTKKPEGPSFKQEAVALLGVFIAVFLLVSIVSHSLGTGKNWCGEAGMLVARFLMDFTGWGAYFLAGLLLLFSLLFFSPRISFDRLPQVTAGLTASVISSCGLLAALSIKDMALFDSGGFLGKTTFALLKSGAGEIGSVLILSLVLIIGVMLATQFSPYLLFSLIGRLFKWISRTFYRVVKWICKTFFWGLGSVAGGVKRTVINKRANRKIVVERGKREKKEPLLDKSGPILTPPPSSSPVPVVKELVKSPEAEDNGSDFALQPIARGDWKLPPLSILDRKSQPIEKVDKEVYYRLSKKLEQKLKNFGVSGQVVGISPGPVVTTYEYSPAPGIKINKIVGLADDLALGLKAKSVRVIGSVPGKAALGIEIPNEQRQIVYLRDMLTSQSYRQVNTKLSMALGLDVAGNPTVADLAKMPHLLIAGATGSGKSVAVNTMIASILFNSTPAEVRFLMVDPKRIELSGYEGIPHLIHPVVVEPKLAARALMWAVKEMERRYRLLEEARVKNFDSYNESAAEKLPYLVVIVDELADLMMVASKDVETSIARLAQMARAAGIHLIIATQRPSVDVLTGLIKANFPTRISFKVSSKVDSRTILDVMGAEHLLGAGDMLFLPPGSSMLKRIHGAFISEAETERLVDFLKKQGGAGYDESVIEEVEKEQGAMGDVDGEEADERYDEAVAIVCESGQASISMLQRRLRVGYNRAARMIEMMEKEGVVGPADGAKPRQVLARSQYE